MKFGPPLIIGALCEDRKEIPRELFKLFGRFGHRIAFLPFEVKRRHLKNTIACMRLMDIAGLVVFGRHRLQIVRHIPSLDKIARHTGSVDIITRKGNRFIGRDAMGLIDRQIMASKRQYKGGNRRHLSKKRGVGLFCQRCVRILTSGLQF